MESVLQWMRPGMSEREVAARLDYEMCAGGAEEPAFSTIVAVGGHAAEPHARPGSGSWRMNQPILFDWGACVGGYRSDLTRCYVAGKIPAAFKDAYRWVLEAQLAAIASVKPGATFERVDEVGSQNDSPIAADVRSWHGSRDRVELCMKARC